MTDTRNVVDEFKDVDHDQIVNQLDKRGVKLEIAIENTLRDFNMGTIVRSANAFGVRRVHVIGRKQWNKRGAMMTDKYLSIEYHASADDFAVMASAHSKQIIALDNVAGSTPLTSTSLPKDCILLFGQEGPGLSTELLAVASKIIAIEQLGSTWSLNVGVAAGVAMYEWLRRHHLEKTTIN